MGKTKQAIRVLMADDHMIFRQGVRKLLEGQDGISIVGETANGNECIAMAVKLKPPCRLGRSRSARRPGRGDNRSRPLALAARPWLAFPGFALASGDQAKCRSTYRRACRLRRPTSARFSSVSRGIPGRICANPAYSSRNATRMFAAR